MFFSRSKKNVDLSKMIGLENSVYDENTRRTRVYYKDGIKHFYKGIYLIPEGKEDRVNIELLSELYLSRIAKEYFGFKTPIYDVARYQCYDKSTHVGVSSKDFTIGYDMVQDMFSLTGKLLPTLKFLRDKKIYDNLPEKLQEDLTNAMLFQLISMQYDMSGVNISFGYSGDAIKDLILYDYGSNSLSNFKHIPSIEEIDEKIADGGRLCFGLDTDLEKYEDMLDELSYSKSINGRYLEKFLNRFGDSKKQQEIISQVGDDVKTMECVYSPQYEGLLTYSMDKMTKLVEKSLNERQNLIKEDGENVL